MTEDYSIERMIVFFTGIAVGLTLGSSVLSYLKRIKYQAAMKIQNEDIRKMNDEMKDLTPDKDGSSCKSNNSNIIDITRNPSK